MTLHIDVFSFEFLVTLSNKFVSLYLETLRYLKKIVLSTIAEYVYS